MMRNLCDFHVHTNYSDGKHSLREIIDFYGSLGFQAIAITDHACETKNILGKAALFLEKTLTKENFSNYLQALEVEGLRAWELYRMRVIPGVEITKNSLLNQRSAHLLMLGLRNWIDPNLSIDEILDEAKKFGCTVVAAHPVHTRKLEKQTYHLWDRRVELSGRIHAWEVASGPYWFSEVEHSGLPMLATSDLHRFEQINSWKTVIDTENQEEALLQAIREQRVSFQYFDLKNEVDYITHRIQVSVSESISLLSTY